VAGFSLVVVCDILNFFLIYLLGAVIVIDDSGLMEYDVLLGE
jgi:hypothetical protein